MKWILLLLLLAPLTFADDLSGILQAQDLKSLEAHLLAENQKKSRHALCEKNPSHSLCYLEEKSQFSKMNPGICKDLSQMQTPFSKWPPQCQKEISFQKELQKYRKKDVFLRHYKNHWTDNRLSL